MTLEQLALHVYLIVAPIAFIGAMTLGRRCLEMSWPKAIGFAVVLAVGWPFWLAVVIIN